MDYIWILKFSTTYW